MFRTLAVLAALLISSTFATITNADDWPQWLGPTRDGIWRETGILQAFPPEGPPLRWKVPVSGGYSGPAVADGKVYVTDWVVSNANDDGTLIEGDEAPLNSNFVRRLRPGTERVRCLDEKTGNLIWQHEYDCPYSSAKTYAIGPRATPTVDGDRVYTLGTEGNLFCLSTKTGEVLWAVDYKKDYGVPVPTWGFAAPPLVDEDRLICIVGGQGTTCVAFNKVTGKEIWRSLSASEPGYSTPVIRKIGDEEQLLVWDAEAVHGLDPKTGDEYWSVPFVSAFGMSIATPQVSGRFVFVMCFNRKSGLIAVGDDGRSAHFVWEGDGTQRGIAGVHNTAQIVDGFVYGCGNGGRYTCAKLKDGEHAWTSYQPVNAKRPVQWGNVFTIRHGNRFFLANDAGELAIARISSTGYEEISKAKLIEPTHLVGSRTLLWSHPAFANQSIYLRNDKELRCYSLKQSE